MESVERSGRRAHNQRSVYKSLRADESGLGSCICVGSNVETWRKAGLRHCEAFCEMSLATLSSRRTEHGATEKAGLTLHDLHLEFCRQEAEWSNSHSAWNSALLSGYLEPLSNPIRLEECALSPSLLAGLTPRRWWSDEIPKDDYIHANLARNLSMCDRGSELASLLLDARWLNVRGKFGGILGLKADFAILDKLLQPFTGDGGEKTHSKDVRRSARLILKAMELSWGRLLRWTESVPISNVRAAVQFEEQQPHF